MPRVSVIVPTRNSDKFIRECLTSVKDQTFRDWEIFLIDSDSNDKTLDVALSTGIPLRIFKVPHRGPGAARNYGVSRSSGEFVAFLDSDDRWRPQKLAKQLDALDQNHDYGATYTDTCQFSNDKDGTIKLGLSSLPCGLIQNNIIANPSLISTSTLLFKRSLWEIVGQIDEESPISEDWEWFIKLAGKTQIAGINEPLVDYRLHANNTHKQLEKNYPYAKKVLTRILELTDQNPTLARHTLSNFHNTYGKAFLFEWKSQKALPCFIRSLCGDPLQGKIYLYLLASFIPGSLLKNIQRWRGRI